MNQYRYLDYEMFTNYTNKFNENDTGCKKHKVKMGEEIVKAIFIFLDVDESGELEQEEILEVL